MSPSFITVSFLFMVGIVIMGVICGLIGVADSLTKKLTEKD